MRLNAIIFLLVTFVVINLTKSQFNNCSTWIPLKNHNSTEFLGDWYGYQRLSNGFKRKEVCSLYQYRWNSTVNAAEMVITNVEENGHIFTRKGQVFQTNPSVAQWKVVLKNGFSFLSSGIALDGKSHAFFAGCRKNEDLVWILTREQYPSEDVKKVINDELDKHNLDKSKLVTLCK